MRADSMRGRAAALLLVLLLLPAEAFAHGVEVYDVSAAFAGSVEVLTAAVEGGAGGNGEGAGVGTGNDAGARAILFSYSTGEPMAFAKIKVYPPSGIAGNVEALVSISDRNGVFCFVPDEDGDWRVDAEDGMGHKGSITVGGIASAPSPADAKALARSGGGAGQGGSLPPRVLGIVAGLSIIANIFGIWRALSNGRKRSADSG
jgi:nickel transport protein